LRSLIEKIDVPLFRLSETRGFAANCIETREVQSLQTVAIEGKHPCQRWRALSSRTHTKVGRLVRAN
jgi:hypothetical protein